MFTIGHVATLLEMSLEEFKVFRHKLKIKGSRWKCKNKKVAWLFSEDQVLVLLHEQLQKEKRRQTKEELKKIKKVDRRKFGNKAVRAFKQKGYKVYPINPKLVEVEGIKAYKSITDVPETSIDMVSMYLPPLVGITVLEEIAKKKIKELWLNPGSESVEIADKAEALGLTVIEACSIVGAGMSPNQLSDD